jgi:integrase
MDRIWLRVVARPTPWKAVLERAKLARQRPYDLRHSFASLLLHKGSTSHASSGTAETRGWSSSSSITCP